MLPIDPQKSKVEQQLDLVHWHMLRGDGLRATLASRAGTLLSTDALIVAGVALALGLQNQHAGYALLSTSLATLICVAVSVVNASLVLMSVRRWHQHFKDTETPQPFLYSYTGMHGSFEDFKARKAIPAPRPSNRSVPSSIGWPTVPRANHPANLRIAPDAP